MDKKKLLLSRLLFFAYLAAVLFLCFGRFESTPDVPRSILGIPADKLVHFCRLSRDTLGHFSPSGDCALS